ncbi:hypothetical protein VTK26DRAFT_8417 [Humicola hyalothermophila]
MKVWASRRPRSMLCSKTCAHFVVAEWLNGAPQRKCPVPNGGRGNRQRVHDTTCRRHGAMSPFFGRRRRSMTLTFAQSLDRLIGGRCHPLFACDARLMLDS